MTLQGNMNLNTTADPPAGNNLEGASQWGGDPSASCLLMMARHVSPGAPQYVTACITVPRTATCAGYPTCWVPNLTLQHNLIGSELETPYIT